jgi:hypothetical protein
VRAGGCGLPELEREGEKLIEEVGADDALRSTAMRVGPAGFLGRQKRVDRLSRDYAVESPKLRVERSIRRGTESVSSA